MVNKVNVCWDITNLTPMMGAFSATSTGGGATGTVTLNRLYGRITTPSLTAVALSNHVLTLTNSHIQPGDTVWVKMNYPTAGTGDPVIRAVIEGTGTVDIVIRNTHATVALNSAAVIDFWVIKRS